MNSTIFIILCLVNILIVYLLKTPEMRTLTRHESTNLQGHGFGILTLILVGGVNNSETVKAVIMVFFRM